jgi:hypothetical protein
MEDVLIFFGVIGALFLGAWHLVGHEWREAEKREKLKLLELELKLLEEKKKPMTRIVFELSNGQVKRFEFLEPRIILERVTTSHDFAKKVLEKCYETGRFRDDEMITYPTCNVAKAWLEKENQHLVNMRNEDGKANA